MLAIVAMIVKSVRAELVKEEKLEKVADEGEKWVATCPSGNS